MDHPKVPLRKIVIIRKASPSSQLSVIRVPVPTVLSRNVLGHNNVPSTNFQPSQSTSAFPQHSALTRPSVTHVPKVLSRNSQNLPAPNTSSKNIEILQSTNAFTQVHSLLEEGIVLEDGIIDNANTIYHSDSVFVAQKSLNKKPKYQDPELIKIRKSFLKARVVDNAENVNQSSIEKEGRFSNDRTPPDIRTDRSPLKEGQLPIGGRSPLKEKNIPQQSADVSTISLDESDSCSLSSDDFVKPHKKKRVAKPKQKAASPIYSSDDINQLMEILPDNYDYKIQYLKLYDGEFINMEAHLRVSIRNAKEAKVWKEDFEKTSKADFRVKKTWGELNCDRRILFKYKYRCHHNTEAEKNNSKKAHSKHTKCPASMTITVKNQSMIMSKDCLLKSHPGVVTLKMEHNHSLKGGDILRFRRPSKEITQIFTEMFTQYPPHSPATARDAYLCDLEVENEFSLLESVKDGSEVPSMQWLYRLFNKINKENCGEATGGGMLSALQNYVQQYNEECGEVCAKMGTTEDGVHNFVVVCSPLMKRVHTHLKASSENMFIDSSGSMDGANARVFMILTPSVACGLPLGMIITFSEREDVISSALELWKTIIPTNAFFGRGLKGPKIIMTDDCTSSRDSLHSNFPLAVLLLCIFHVLNAMWRYVWDAKHNVRGQDRQKIYFRFHQILYASSVEEFDKLFDEAQEDVEASGHDIVAKHLKDLRPRAGEWALCHRADLLTRGHDTNNICEAGMRVLKDKILNRLKAFNPVQLLHYLLTRLDKYYKRKLAFLINNRVEGSQRSRYSVHPDKLKPLVAEKVSSSSNLYRVKNMEKKTEYLVNMDLEVCACLVGRCGSTCKHQAAVSKVFGVSNHQLLPYNDPVLKTVLFYIMIGDTNIPEGYFDTLKGGKCNPVDLSTIPEFNHVYHSTIPEEDGSQLNSSFHSETLELDYDNANTHPQETSEISNAPAVIEKVLFREKLDPFLSDLIERCDASPEVFKEPVEKFLKNYWKAVKTSNSDSTLTSALSTFAQDQCQKGPIRRGRIKTQPTASARRKAHKGGKGAQKGGRPRKAGKETGEHAYGKKRKAAPPPESWAYLPKKSKVPHSLSQCATANVRLPK